MKKSIKWLVGFFFATIVFTGSMIVYADYTETFDSFDLGVWNGGSGSQYFYFTSGSTGAVISEGSCKNSKYLSVTCQPDGGALRLSSVINKVDDTNVSVSFNAMFKDFNGTRDAFIKTGSSTITWNYNMLNIDTSGDLYAHNQKVTRLTTDTWYNIAYNYDLSAKRLNVYINGVLLLDNHDVSAVTGLQSANIRDVYINFRDSALLETIMYIDDIVIKKGGFTGIYSKCE